MSWKHHILLPSVLGVLALGLHGPAGEKNDKGHTFSLKPKEDGFINVCFAAGKEVDIKVRSEKETDVDLFVQDPTSRYKLVASDEKVGKDCNVRFTPSRTQFYRLLVKNLGPGDNKSTLSVSGAVQVPAKKLEPADIKDKGEVKYQVTFAADKPAAIWVESEKESDLDVFVYDQENNLVAKDIELSKNCFVALATDKTQAYRVEVVNLGPGDNRFTLKHTGEKAEKK